MMKIMKKIITTFILVAVLAPLSVVAQNVSIDLVHGSMLNAVTPGDDTGWANGFSTMWRHEQLSLSMMGADRDELTDAGEIGYPSAVFGNRNGNITIVGGRRPSFIVVSLPKGYRITGYELVLANDMIGADLGGRFNTLNTNQEPGSSNGYGTMRFYEVKPWETDKTNSGTHNRLSDEDNDGYNATRVRFINPGTNWQATNVQDGQIGTAASDILATAEDANHNINIRTNDTNGTEYTIKREATKIGGTEAEPIYDMDNHLYFRLVKDYCFYGLTIKSFMIYFSAEGTFEADVVPDAIGQATSVVRSPFLTSKIDIGEMGYHEKDGVQYYSFDYENVKDIVGYNYLYQEDAVLDGKPADVAQDKHIYPVKVDNQMLYALGNGTYYIETPTEILNSEGNASPIGYRIVGALFNYLWGTATPGQEMTGDSHFYITYESGGTTYYLNDGGRFTTNKTTEWELDNNGNVKVKDGNVYLGCSGNQNNRTLTADANAQSRLRIDDNNRLYYTRNNGTTLYLHGTTSATTTPTVTNSQSDLAAWTDEPDSYTTPSFTPGAYTLKVWKRDGSAVKETITVNSAADAGVYDMGLCNNDAIKFQISDLENGKQALVSVTLLLQALDPYIDKMDIVCHDDRDVLQLTQSFTADNFSVAGDKFIFYVPEDYAHEMLTFTFSGLYSKYGDETYYDRSGHGAGRYSFVTSPYFVPVNGDGNDGLYSTTYSPDAPYNNKVYTSTAGKYRFKFNNAEDLANSTTPGTLEEYPFSVSIYKDTENPGDPTASPAIAASTDKGTFIDCKLQADLADQKSGTYYVFTADETRWNIAPTTAWQHRFYAFYRMEIELRAKTFTPALTWTKVYDKTCYYDEVNNEGTDAEDSMWGLTLDVSDTDSGQKIQGYLTYQEIIDNIKGREETLWTADDENRPEGVAVGSVKWSAITGQLDPNNTNAPASMKQILYIDGTPLYAMLNSSQYSEVKTLEDLKDELPNNSIVFLPENTTSTLDNVAYKTSSGSFRAGKDIDITDRKPFYTPYDIQVDAANRATYTRVITWEGYDKDTNATLILPFTLLVDENGKHTNDDCSFTVNEMLSGTEMATVDGSGVNYGTAFFTPYTRSRFTEANKPYMIHVESLNANAGEDVSFIAWQKGATVEATPTTAAATPKGNNNADFCTGLLHKGESVQATFNSVDYYFTNYGSYSGAKFDRAASEDVFYFGKDRYLNLHTLSPSTEQYLYTYPFRAVYVYTTSAPASNHMRWFDISYDDYEAPGMATGICEIANKPDLMVRSGKGYITLTAARGQQVNIFNGSGIQYERLSLKDGDTHTVNLPAGIYIVNNVKVIVK